MGNGLLVKGEGALEVRVGDWERDKRELYHTT